MKFISLILSISLLFSFNLSFNENPIEVIQDSEELIHPFSGGLNKPKIQWVDWDSDNDDDLFILDEDGYITYKHKHYPLYENGDENKYCIESGSALVSKCKICDSF